MSGIDDYIQTCNYELPFQVFDSDGQTLGKYSGSTARPPVTMSTGPTMLVRFAANGGTGLGYRAKLQFLTLRQANETVSRITNCGGFVESLGGAITMMNMVRNGSESIHFDCIWLIKPSNSYIHLKTHLLLGVDAFDGMGKYLKTQ